MREGIKGTTSIYWKLIGQELDVRIVNMTNPCEIKL